MTVHNCCNKEKDVAAKCRMISSRSVTDGVSLSDSKSKLVYSSLIFGDNKLTLICINITTISKSFCPLYTSYLLIWRVLHL